MMNSQFISTSLASVLGIALAVNSTFRHQPDFEGHLRVPNSHLLAFLFDRRHNVFLNNFLTPFLSLFPLPLAPSKCRRPKAKAHMPQKRRKLVHLRQANSRGQVMSDYRFTLEAYSTELRSLL